MREEPLTTVQQEVLTWPGVTLGDTGRGGTQFNYGTIELGHLHGNAFADLPFTRKLRDELIAAGRAEVHAPLPTSGWARRWMRTAEDVQDVIALFRLNYERALLRAERQRHAVTDDEG